MGMALYFKLSFPQNAFLKLMVSSAFVHEGLSTPNNHFLFHDPLYRLFDCAVGPYVFGLTLHKKIRVGELPPYPGRHRFTRSTISNPRRTPTTIIETAKTHMKEDEAILMAISANQNAIGIAKLALERVTTRDSIRRIADGEATRKDDPIY